MVTPETQWQWQQQQQQQQIEQLNLKNEQSNTFYPDKHFSKEDTQRWTGIWKVV